MNKYFGFRQQNNVLASVRVGADSSTVKQPADDQSGLMAAGGLIAVVGLVFLIPVGMFVIKHV